MGIFRHFKKSKTTKEEHPQPMDGSISIVNGEVIVRDPEFGGRYAEITNQEPEHIEVIVNGVPIEEKTEVRSTDTITIHAPEESVKEAEKRLSFVASEDKMTLLAKVEVTEGVVRKVQEIEKMYSVSVRRSEEYAPPAPFTREEVVRSIEEEGYIGTILEEHLHILTQPFSPGEAPREITILEGTRPIEGVPGYYELLYEVKGINLIHSEELIARYHEEIPPTPGKDIFGKEVVNTLHTKLPKLHDSVRVEDGKLYANISGRLVFDEEKISVIPQLVITRNVTEQDGIIHYKEGDILVEGDVLEGSFLQASGMIHIKKGSHGATIIAETGVTSQGNIEKTTVFSGWTRMARERMTDFMSEILRELELLVPVIEEVMPEHEFEDEKEVEKRRQARKRERRLVVQRIKEKKKEREHVLFAHIMTNGEKELVLAYTWYRDTLDRLFGEISGVTVAPSLKRNLQDYIDTITSFLAQSEELPSVKESPVTVDSVTSSVVYSSGEMNIEGAGVYMSELYSGNSIHISGRVKGSVITAEKEVEIGKSYKAFNVQEFGIYVRSPKGRIKIGKRYPDTLLSVGGVENVSYTTDENVVYEGE